ncbi:hypothetical protein QOZ80_1AG0007900 [Eleusine coracana subsp. coracana]|nr:hypothetical protein QOZ80_1AG0007900 [Eleusine coracana subsp. coracana]
MTTTCQFKRYGCCETVRFTEKRSHEDACLRAPFDCPFAGCRYRGLQLYDHVQDAHAADAVYVISYVRGTAVTLRKGNVELEYTLEVSGGDEPGALALSAAGTVPCARGLDGFQAKGFLFVPDAYWGDSDTVSVKVRV